jgi:hypothetical protein
MKVHSQKVQSTRHFFLIEELIGLSPLALPKARCVLFSNLDNYGLSLIYFLWTLYNFFSPGTVVFLNSYLKSVTRSSVIGRLAAWLIDVTIRFQLIIDCINLSLADIVYVKWNMGTIENIFGPLLKYINCSTPWVSKMDLRGLWTCFEYAEAFRIRPHPIL